MSKRSLGEKFIMSKRWIIEKGYYSEHRDLAIEMINQHKAGNINKDEFKAQDISVVKGNTAIIPIVGVITRYSSSAAGLFDETSIATISKSFAAAMADVRVKRILFDINSPGGMVDGVAEMADEIFDARDKKEIISYVSFQGASAAYWLAAAASRVVMHETAMVGSIGVLQEFPESDGGESVVLVSDISPKKVVDVTTEEGREQIQGHINKLGKIFVEKVALYRGLNSEFVVQSFGNGDVVIGDDALGKKMVDEIGSFKTAMSGKPDRGIDNKNLLKGELSMKFKMKTVLSKMSAKFVVVDDEEQEQELTNPEEIDKQWIENNLPDIAEEFRNEGREEENARRESIDSVDDTDELDETDNDEQELRQKARTNTKMSAGQFALDLNVLKKEKKAKAKTDAKATVAQEIIDRTADADEIPDVKTETGDIDGSDPDQKQRHALMSTAISKFRRIS